MDPIVVASARKHGIPDDDILHAYQHPIRILRLDDLLMLIGSDQSGRLLEIGISAGDGIDFIVHAMLARPKFIR